MAPKRLFVTVLTLVALLVPVGALSVPTAAADPVPQPVPTTPVVAGPDGDWPFEGGPSAPQSNPQSAPQNFENPLPGVGNTAVQWVRKLFRCFLAVFSSDLSCQL